MNQQLLSFCSIVIIYIITLLIPVSISISISISAVETDNTINNNPLTDLLRINYYDLFQLTPETIDPKSLKVQYRKLSLLYHPDRAAAATATATAAGIDSSLYHSLFVRLSTGYEVLSDDKLTARYNYQLSIDPTTVDYDSNRNWSEFDFNSGFIRVKRAEGETEQQYRFRDPYTFYQWQQQEAAAENRALILSFSIAGIFALIPLYYYYRNKLNRTITAAANKSKQSAALKSNQSILKQIELERTIELEQQRAADREYAAELKELRLKAAAEAATESDSVLDNTNDEPIIDNEADADADSDDNNTNSDNILYHCKLCSKRFKSSGQLDNHENSKQHKKAVLAEQRANRK